MKETVPAGDFATLSSCLILHTTRSCIYSHLTQGVHYDRVVSYCLGGVDVAGTKYRFVVFGALCIVTTASLKSIHPSKGGSAYPVIQEHPFCHEKDLGVWPICRSARVAGRLDNHEQT